MSTVSTFPRGRQPRAVVAAEIRALMGRHDRTQTDLALAVGVSQSQMSKRLKGVIPLDVDELVLIADYFGVSVAELFGERPSVRPTPMPPNDGIRGTRGYPRTAPVLTLASAA